MRYPVNVRLHGVHMKNTILMVDDNEDMREIFAELFENTDIKVICFSNVLDAKVHLINATNASQVKAIISDLMMGPTDGLEFLSYVKAKPDLADIDFYLLTGAAITVFEPFLRPFVLKGIIEKPFDGKALVSMFTNANTRYQKAA